MPCTPWRRTSSATRKASTIDVCLSSTLSSLLLGTTMRVSTSSASACTPMLGGRGAAVALEAERLGHDADGQRAQLAGDARDDRRRAGARPAAGTGGDEDHVRALEQRLDAVVLLHRGLAPEIGVRAGAQPAGDLRADVQRDVGRRLLQRLQVGVDGEELDALDLGLDHAVDGVDAGPADADDAQHGLADRLGGAPRRRLVGDARVRIAAGVLPGRRRLEDVVGDVRAEGVAQALLRRGHVRLGRRRRVGRRAERRMRVAGLARVRWRRLRRAALLGGRRGRRGDATLVGLGGGALGLLGRLLGLAEQVRERPLPHARALTACHGREPPSRDRDRTGRPSRPDRT